MQGTEMCEDLTHEVGGASHVMGLGLASAWGNKAEMHLLADIAAPHSQLNCSGLCVLAARCLTSSQNHFFGLTGG
jgi:hypothetical protein